MRPPPLRIALFCHVETGTSRDRTIVFHPRHREGIVLALERTVEFADRNGLRMTFAMTPTALHHSETDLSGHEVGLHLHPRDAVLRDAIGRATKLSTDCLANYSRNDQAVLIRTAKDIFEESEGRSPRTFVAGRWSENDATVDLLSREGLAYDGSPLPGHVSDCADWRNLPRLAQPYTPSQGNYQGRGSLRILHIPVFQGLWGHYLTPENIHLLGVSYFVAAMREAKIGGSEVVHVFFHSPMAVDPYFLDEFESVVAYARDRLDAEFVLPSALEAARAPVSRPFPPAYIAGLRWRLVKTWMSRGRLGERLMGGPALQGGSTSAPARTNDDGGSL